MPYEFFLSYARTNYNDYVKKFFKELSAAVRDRLPSVSEPEVGFFDQHLELGAHWEQSVATALQTSKTLVCLYSPAYFESEYCGKEWHVFHMYRKLYAQQNRSGGEDVLPSIIKPVFWQPFHINLPKVVSDVQYLTGDSRDVHNIKGLKHVRMLMNKYSTKYKEYIEDLAGKIVEAGRNYQPQTFSALPPLSDVESLFKSNSDEYETPSAQHGVTSLKNVKFVFVAAAPEHFPQEVRKQLECYKLNGGRDWKPFFPEQQKPIRAFAQYIAASEDLDFYSDELPFGADLPERIRDAETERSLVVLLVDSWTATLPFYKEILERFDENNYINCSVLVPWNENDEETAQKLNNLKIGIRETFRRWARRHKTVYFHDDIKSIEDLRTQIRSTLVQLQMEIINDPEVIPFRRANGEGPQAKPSL